MRLLYDTPFSDAEKIFEARQAEADSFYLTCGAKDLSEADQLSCRLTHIFLRGPNGRRAVFGANETFQADPHWRDYLLFYEYFHGDTGRGVGASHQIGWTGLVAKLLEQTEGR